MARKPKKRGSRWIVRLAGSILLVLCAFAGWTWLTWPDVAALTWQLERNLEKRRILELYLNLAQFGPEVYGIEAAARRYFGVSAAGLDAEQAASLAASLPRPSSWHPGVERRGYRRAVERIRIRVEQCNWLDQLL